MKAFTIFELEDAINGDVLADAVELIPSTEPDTTQAFRIGFAAPFDGEDALVQPVGSSFLVCVRKVERLVSGKALKQVTAQRAAELAKKQGYAVGRKQQREIREEVQREMLQKAYLTTSDTHVLIDDKRVIVLTASDKKSTEAVTMIGEALGTLDVPFKLTKNPIVNLLPKHFTGWVIDGDTGSDMLSLGGAFRSETPQSSVLSGKNVNLSDLENAINNGYIPTELELVIDETKFTLTSDFVFKKITWPKHMFAEAEDQAAAYFLLRDAIRNLTREVQLAVGVI